MRWSEHVCILEGPDLVVAALEAGREFEGVYIDAAHANDAEVVALIARAETAGVRCFELESGVLAKVADAETPQPVLAAVRFEATNLATLPPHGLVVVLHELRDPGNVGTIIRTADAAGAAAVILSGHCVDPYNPKTLRASAGSIFHVPVVLENDLAAVARWFAHDGARAFATTVRGGRSHRDVDLTGDAMLIFGNESEGLSDAQCDLFADRLSIEMVGRNESLNVAVSVGIVLFESLAQRRSGEDAGPTISPR